MTERHVSLHCSSDEAEARLNDDILDAIAWEAVRNVKSRLLEILNGETPKLYRPQVSEDDLHMTLTEPIAEKIKGLFPRLRPPYSKTSCIVANLKVTTDDHSVSIKYSDELMSALFEAAKAEF